MVCAGVYSQMPVVVATVLAILAFITSCYYSILNSARNNMSTAYFECITFWKFKAKRSKKYKENAVRLLKRANWCACLYKDYCIIVRWWFSSVILMFFSFLFIIAALTFSQFSHFLKCVFWFLFILSIICAFIAIRAITIEHPYKSKYLNWKIFWDKTKIFNPHLADKKFGEFEKEICKIEKLDEGILKCPKWFEDNKTKSKEF